jgi:hypothetical protein
MSERVKGNSRHFVIRLSSASLTNPDDIDSTVGGEIGEEARVLRRPVVIGTAHTDFLPSATALAEVAFGEASGVPRWTAKMTTGTRSCTVPFAAKTSTGVAATSAWSMWTALTEESTWREAGSALRWRWSCRRLRNVAGVQRSWVVSL